MSSKPKSKTPTAVASSSTTAHVEQHLNSLKHFLSVGSARSLELLAADLIAALIDVRLALSDSGFQFGGDAGTAGSQDRHIRVECKRYSESTPLSKRELQGEIDDALSRNPDLEAWILVSTRRADEGLRETLSRKADEKGLAVIVIDWDLQHGDLPELAALCAFSPSLVERHYGAQAAEAAEALHPAARAAIKRIREELEPWKIGYEKLRDAAAVRIREMWTSSSQSQAMFGQNVAGGASGSLLNRPAILALLDDWWNNEAKKPCVAYGAEGVGKTWATMQWVIRELDRLPIVLVTPSSALADIGNISDVTVTEFLASELYSLTRTRNRKYWEQRVRRHLARPAGEGPTFLLILDGLNQEPSVDWRRLLQVLQGNAFCDSLRVLLTAQTHFLQNELRGLRSFAHPVSRIGIEPYDASPSGELDQLLARHGIERAELTPELISLARIPRLFDLVVRFRQEATLKGGVTVNRLLWAYGRDEHGLREQRAFSETEWVQWLVGLAETFLEQMCARTPDVRSVATSISYSASDLATSASASYRSAKENSLRLGEIISGTWMEPVPGSNGVLRPKESTIALALGAALLSHLEAAAANGNSPSAALATWLDPIVATSAAADILAAAVSILVAKEEPNQSDIATTVLTALLQSQNVSDGHRDEVKALAPPLAMPLIDVIERSAARAQGSARWWAVQALRSIPSSSAEIWLQIEGRLVEWIAHATCPTTADKERSQGSPGSHSHYLVERLGTDEPGTHTVMGLPFRLHYGQSEGLEQLVPPLLQGKPLIGAIRVLAAACVAHAIDMFGNDAWTGMRWLVLLNEVDRNEVVEKLREVADAALHVPAELGIGPDFTRRTSAFLLWLAGSEASELEALARQSTLEDQFDYNDDYLSKPSKSYMPLEFRHAEMTMGDIGVTLVSRVNRIVRYLPSPSLEAPPVFVDQLRGVAEGFDVTSLDTRISPTLQDHHFEQLKGAFARFIPREFGALTRRRLATLRDRSDEARHWASLRAPDHILLVDETAAESARALRLNLPATLHKDEPFIASRLFHLELLPLCARRQLDALVEAPDVPILDTLRYAFRPADAETLGDFIGHWGVDHRRAVEVLFNQMAAHDVQLPDALVDQLARYAFVEGEESEGFRNEAFICLSGENSAKFGEFLLRNGWKFGAGQTIFEQQYGSVAVVAASTTQSLKYLAALVAPWVLLREACNRGKNDEDVKLAARSLHASLSAAQNIDVGAFDCQIMVDVTGRPGFITLGERPQASANGASESLADAFNFDRQRQLQHEARQSALRQLEGARAAGASLYTIVISVDDARALVHSASAEVDAWLDGLEEMSNSFIQRINLASGLFCALCEALLASDPSRGVLLWRALTEKLHIKHTGLADISDLMHMPFRVAGSPQIDSLRNELYALCRNATVTDYLETVICATANGCSSWLNAQILEDESSAEDWRKKRAVMMRGLTDEVPIDELEWFEGDADEAWRQVRREAQLWRNRRAYARYWWEKFAEANDDESAYAAWQVFLTCADARAWIWMQAGLPGADEFAPLTRRKLLHLQLARSALERAIKDVHSKSGTNASESLMGWKSPTAWLDLSQFRGKAATKDIAA